MTDAQRGEVFTSVPTGEARDAASALVLPDALADALKLGGSEGDLGQKWSSKADGEAKEQGMIHRPNLLGGWPSAIKIEGIFCLAGRVRYPLGVARLLA